MIDRYRTAHRNRRLASRSLRQFILDKLAEHGAVNVANLADWFHTEHRFRPSAALLQYRIASMKREGVIRAVAHGVLINAFANPDPRAIFAATYPAAMDTLAVLAARDRSIRLAELPIAFRNVHGRKRSAVSLAKDRARLEAEGLVAYPRWGYVRATDKGLAWSAPKPPSIFD